jgi:hypothetical protein
VRMLIAILILAILSVPDKAGAVVVHWLGGLQQSAPVCSCIEASSLKTATVRPAILTSASTYYDYCSHLERILSGMNAYLPTVIVIGISTAEGSLQERELIRRLHAKGALIICDAGYGGCESGRFPAAYAETIAVGASNASLSPTYGNADLYDDDLGLVIPAVDSADDASAALSVPRGSEFAAAKIAGLIAYIMHRRPELTRDEIVALFKQNSKNGVVRRSDVLMTADPASQVGVRVIAPCCAFSFFGGVAILILLARCMGDLKPSESVSHDP